MDYNNGQPYQKPPEGPVSPRGPVPPAGPGQGPYQTIPTGPPAPANPANSLAVASMVLGIAAIVLACTVYLSPVLGGVAVILAILSRGAGKKLHGFAKTGIITASVAVALDIALVTASFALIFSNPDMQRDFWRMYKEMGEEMYGDNFDDMMKEAFGENFDIDKYIEGTGGGAADSYENSIPDGYMRPENYGGDSSLIGLHGAQAAPEDGTWYLEKDGYPDRNYDFTIYDLHQNP